MKLTKKLISKLLEAALFTKAEPMSAEKLRKFLPREQRPPLGEVRTILDDLVKHYQNRGVQLVEVASGYRFQINEEASEYLIERQEEKPMRMSKAFMETLALVAYRQPITRGEIEDIRGVAVSSNIIKSLLELEWIREVGHKDVPGKPSLFATTKKFLDFFNLKSLGDLPPLAQLEELSENRMKEEYERLNEALEHELDEEQKAKIQEQLELNVDADEDAALNAQAPEGEENAESSAEIHADEDATDVDTEFDPETIDMMNDEAIDMADLKRNEDEFEMNEDQIFAQSNEQDALELDALASELNAEEIDVEVEQGVSNHRPLEEFSEIAFTGPIQPDEKKESGGEDG